VKGIIKYMIMLIITAATIQSGNAQHPLIKSFDIRSEGSRPKILRLLCARDGMIWTGTDQGIFNFDGITFSKIAGSDSSFYGSVSSLFQDKAGVIWAGFENGRIVNISNRVMKRFSPQEGFPKVPVSAFAEDNSGHLYFSTLGEGVYCIERNIIYNIDHDDGLSDDYCYSMTALPDGRMAIGTDAGLNFIRFNDEKKNVKVYSRKDGVPDEIVKTLECDANGKLWIGMQDAGIACFDILQNKIVYQSTGWIHGAVNKMEINEEWIWIITEEQGIFIKHNDGTIRKLEFENERDIKFNDIVTDRENNIWFAESIHLVRTSGKKLGFIENIGNRKLSFIHCILSTADGKIWFSPDQQLGCIFQDEDRLQYKEYKITSTRQRIDIVTLYEDKYGFIWIGTLGDGAYRFNPHTGKSRKVTSTSDIESSSILSINGDENRIWIAGFNGVVEYNIISGGENENAVIRTNNGGRPSLLGGEYVYSVFIDSKKTMWLGTDDNGIYKLRSNVLENIPVKGNSVHSFTEDRKGRIWFSTADAGLGIIEGDKIRYLQVKDGLSDPSASAITLAGNGTIVMVYANGFDVIDPETHNVVYHSAEENLADINSDLNSIHTSKDGVIWMGTERGIIVYRPYSDLRISRPQLILQEVSTLSSPVETAGEHKFSYDENNLRFTYSALWYSDPQRVNYSYMLEGYSRKWEKTKDQSVTFPKLPPGKYSFYLKASLNSNFESASPVKYDFIITPPVWLRWWFRILAAGAVAFILFFIIRKREERLRNFERLQKEKVEFQFEVLRSQVNPHFLFNSFNTLISVIEDNPHLAVEYVEKLSEFFRSIVTNRDRNLIPLEDELELLDNYIFIQKKRYGSSLHLEINLSNEVKKNWSLPPLTLQLLAENAIKHNAVSVESPLYIKISFSFAKLMVENNINKKISKPSSPGMGLQNITGRYRLLTDNRVLISSDEKKFVVAIPLISKKENEYTHH
jgi:ligand-binding sensor domain-containing protein